MKEERQRRKWGRKQKKRLQKMLLNREKDCQWFEMEMKELKSVKVAMKLHLIEYSMCSQTDMRELFN